MHSKYLLQELKKKIFYVISKIWFVHFYRASAVAASPVLATIGMSVCPSVRHTLTLCENDAS